jgi:hypothetical protein
MPYASDKQRKYLHAAKPAVAAKFDKHAKKSSAANVKKAATKRKGKR